MEMIEFYKLQERFYSMRGSIATFFSNIDSSKKNNSLILEIKEQLTGQLEEIKSSIILVNAEILGNVYSNESQKRNDYEELIRLFINDEWERVMENFDSQSPNIKPIKNNIYSVDNYFSDLLFKDEFERVFVHKKKERGFILNIHKHLINSLLRISFVRTKFPQKEKNVKDLVDKRMVWKSSSYHFGHLINELINKGYFGNLPQHNSETNSAEIARMFNTIIDFRTSEQVLQNSFRSTNIKLSETVKNKFDIPEFKIPNLADIQTKNKSKPKSAKSE